MSYAIVRIAKLKQSNLGGSGLHVSRGRVTPNADLSKLEDNQTLIHNDDRDLPLSEVVNTKIYSTPQRRKIRTDAVYAVEMLLTASPEYFRPDDPSKYGDYEADKLAEWVKATKQWLGREYGDKIVRAELHLDEATPHIHAYLVPVDEAGQLNCRKLFGGRDKMFALQDSYAAATKHLGLERGIKGSIAEHTDVKDYYSVVNAASNELSIDTPQVMKTKAAAYEQMKRDKEELERRLKLLAEQRDKLAAQLQISQESIVTQSQITSALANPKPIITPSRVAVELQIDPHQLDPTVGVIDLVASTRGTNLGGAVSWLNERFGAAATIQLLNSPAKILASIPPANFIPPDPIRGEWGEVRDYLTSTKKLPAKLVDRLHDEGLIYASENKLICLHKDFDGRVTGATSIDTSTERVSGELVEGSNRTSGWAYFEDNPQASVERVVVTDDPIESMAYSVVNDADSPTLYLATHAGGWVPGDRLGNIEVVIATEMELVNLPPVVERHLPTGTSWLDDLKTLTESVIPDEIIQEPIVIIPEPVVETIEIVSAPEPQVPPKRLTLDEIAKLPIAPRVVRTRQIDRDGR
jgi:Plasmid recombination enzyme